MKRLARVSETEVIAEFLRNEFYQSDFHRDRDKFERIVLNPDFTDELENAVRRALLFRRRGHMWRELPADTEWWRIRLEPQDVERIRVFPRAHWRKIGDGNFQLTEIARRIRGNHFHGSVRDFVSKIEMPGTIQFTLSSHEIASPPHGFSSSAFHPRRGTARGQRHLSTPRLVRQRNR